MTAGQEFVKFLKPVGCVIVLLFSIAAIVLCLTPPDEPLPGLEPAHDNAYYAQHLDELQAELEESVFPRLGGIRSCVISEDRLCIGIDGKNYDKVCKALSYYYDKDLFEFQKTEKN